MAHRRPGPDHHAPGENLARTGALGDAPMARTLAAVRDYVARGARLGASEIRIVATSAVREASNGRAFAAAVEQATGQRVNVVSGEVEARLTLLGVGHGLGRLSGLVLTFDIGGGARSTCCPRVTRSDR